MNIMSPLDLAWIGTLVLVSATVAMWIFVICARWWRARSSARRETRRRAAETAILRWVETRDEVDLHSVLSLKPRILLETLSTTLPKIIDGEREMLISALSRSSFAKYVRRHFHGGDEPQRLLCCEILGAIGGCAASATLVSALADPAASVRIGAAISLAQSGQLPSLHETLAKLGREGLASSRLIQFFQLLLPSRRREILSLVRDASVNSQIRISALGALARQGDADLIILLKELAEDRASPLVVEVAMLLGALDHPESSPVLTSLLKKDCVHVRRAAARSVGSLGDDRFSYTLLPMLLDHDDVVRNSAARSMDRLAMLSGNIVTSTDTLGLDRSAGGVAKVAA
jgi:HEAT repeat protein